MKISELAGALARRAEKYGDLEVMVTWEGTVHDLDFGDIYASRLRDDGKVVLMFNGDEGCDKAEMALDPHEGERW